MNIVEKIDAYCEQEGITIKEFERRCNLANAVVHKWRAGLNQPSFSAVNRICRATETDIGAWI